MVFRTRPFLISVFKANDSPNLPSDRWPAVTCRDLGRRRWSSPWNQRREHLPSQVSCSSAQSDPDGTAGVFFQRSSSWKMELFVFRKACVRDIFFVVVVGAYVVIARGFSGLQLAGDFYFGASTGRNKPPGHCLHLFTSSFFHLLKRNNSRWQWKKTPFNSKYFLI